MQDTKPSSMRFELPDWAAFLLRLVRRVALAVLLAAVVFAVLELAARYLFPGRSTRFLLAGASDGQPAWVDNQFFAYRFFPERLAHAPLPVVALQTPAPDTLRICLMGGSQALGAPDPSFGLGRQLELMLESRYPHHPVEVVQMALEGANSHVLREAARDLQWLRPQAVIVLLGNEEAAGPYAPAAGLGRLYRRLGIARALAIFSRTRLSQLGMAGINRLFPARIDLAAWRNQEPISLKGRLEPGDPRLQTVYRSFRHNLAAILRDAAQAAPVVVACTVPVNLRDCAPFATDYLKDETAAQRVRELLRAAVAAETATNQPEAARFYAEALQLHPTHAEALFRAGRLALQANRPVEAANFFARARDADALRLRADSRINDIVRTCAAAAAVTVFDAEDLFAKSSPHGIPGHELFLDHVHFAFAGNHLLAAALVERLELLRAFEPEPTGIVPGPEQLADELLYAPWGRAAELATVVAQQIRPPFQRQLNNAETVGRLNAELANWETRVAAISPSNTQAIFSRRQASRPQDAWLAARTAQYLLGADDPARAQAAAERAHRRWPHRFDVRGLLAYARACQGEDPAAAIASIRGADRDCGYFDVALAIAVGQEFLGRKRYADARPWLEHAVARDPWNSAAAIALSQTLHRLDESPKAVETLQAAIKRNPQTPLLWEELAALYCLLGDWKIATQCFRKSEEIAPYRYERFLKWAQALYSLKQYRRAQRRIADYLAAVPNDPEALALQVQIQANLPPETSPAEPEDEQPVRRYPWE